MKLLKKLMVVFVAALMTMSLTTRVYADDEAVDPFKPETTVKVTVNGVMPGDTLHLYKIMTPTLNNKNEIVFNWVAEGIEDALKDLDNESGYEPTAAVQKALAKLIAEGKIDVSGNGDFKVTAEGTSAVANVAPGYYVALVKNGTGSLEAKVIYQNMIINAIPVPDSNTGKYVKHEDITVDVKKTTETLTKTQMEAGAADYVATTVEGYKIGDYIPFKIVTNIPSYPTNSKVAKFEISDSPTGLNIVSSEAYPVVVKVAGTVVAAGSSTYSLSVTGGALKIEFVKDYILANPGATVEVTYSAELLGKDSDIEVDITNNKAEIKYNSNPDEESYNEPETEIKQKTFNFTVLKHEKGKETVKLAGAKFSLWTAAENGTKITVIKDGDVYRPVKSSDTAPTEEVLIETNANGVATVVGLANATYYLQEEVAPAGYKKLDTRVECAASETTSTTEIDYKIPNTPGATLPSTGGIGTTIFHIAGAVLVLGAGILLISKKRMNNN